MAIELDGATIPTDPEGYLLDPADWNEAVAEELARREGITLGADHWKVIGFMRDFYAEHRIAPGVRFTIKYIATELGKGRSANPYLLELFPYGYVTQACKIAGMRRPRAWSTG